MKIAIPFLATLLVTATVLGARATTQGLLPALVSTVLELGVNRRRVTLRR
jgi:hypothetical protein